MTEDDTFSALRKISFDEMKRIYADWQTISAEINICDWYTERAKFIKEHGWTVSEFTELYARG